MKKFSVIIAFFLSVVFVFSMSACNPVDRQYGVTSDESSTEQTVQYDEDVSHPKIMSMDRVMSKFVDISLFDEENYSDIYLGKNFRFNVTYCSKELTVPTTIADMKKLGWLLEETNQYNEDSTVYACEAVDAVFKNESGVTINAIIYNSSNTSLKLDKCSVVSLRFENDFYTDTANHSEFNINGINNLMAVTDIIDTLGTPSHFYAISHSNYYLDYFITEDDRRNGITVYINPADDQVTAVEISYYE